MAKARDETLLQTLNVGPMVIGNESYLAFTCSHTGAMS